MKIVFFCYGGTHASPVAAAIYLGQLPADRPPKEQLQALTLFDRESPREFGRLIPVGTADNGDEVFIIGCRRYPQIVLRALQGFATLLGQDCREYHFVDVRPCINWLMRIGGYASRSLGLVQLGRPVVTYGTWLAYPRIAALVERTRSQVERARAGRGEGGQP
ncbi:MAG: DUF3189 family protein [Chitinophagales bacterium]